MRILVTGSSGHLGEALCRVLGAEDHEVVGIDLVAGAFTASVGSITDRRFVRRCMEGVDAVVHAATLHKPHLGSHSRQQFVDTNVTGTLCLLEEAVGAGAGPFVYSSTTSAFGQALTPEATGRAAWITEEVFGHPRNIYGLTKTAAEGLCELFARDHGVPTIVLRIARFFPEPDDNPAVSDVYADANVKLNELLYRRVDIADVVSAHRAALRRAPDIAFGRFIVSATTPFEPGDTERLATDAPAVVAALFPDFERIYRSKGWRMFPAIDRVYDNGRARRELGWEPVYSFGRALASVADGRDWRSPLAAAVGAKGYHTGTVWPYTARFRGTAG